MDGKRERASSTGTTQNTQDGPFLMVPSPSEVPPTSPGVKFAEALRLAARAADDIAEVESFERVRVEEQLDEAMTHFRNLVSRIEAVEERLDDNLHHLQETQRRVQRAEEDLQSVQIQVTRASAAAERFGHRGSSPRKSRYGETGELDVVPSRGRGERLSPFTFWFLLLWAGLGPFLVHSLRVRVEDLEQRVEAPEKP